MLELSREYVGKHYLLPIRHRKVEQKKLQTTESIAIDDFSVNQLRRNNPKIPTCFSHVLRANSASLKCSENNHKQGESP